MNTVSQYAFYGSLRRGMFNFNIYKDHLHYRSTEIVVGFSLYALEDYPIAVKTGKSEDKIMVEIFRITSQSVERHIHNMEIMAGYYFDVFDIKGVQTGIYLFKRKHNYPLIKGGDWVKYSVN